MRRFAIAAVALLLAPLTAHAANGRGGVGPALRFVKAPSNAVALRLAAKKFPGAKIDVNADITASGQPAFRMRRSSLLQLQGRLIGVEPKSNNATPFITYITKTGQTLGKYSGDL
jgi:hypothetical protein